MYERVNTVDKDSTIANAKWLRIRIHREKLSITYYLSNISYYIIRMQTHRICDDTYIDITTNPIRDVNISPTTKTCN